MTNDRIDRVRKMKIRQWFLAVALMASISSVRAEYYDVPMMDAKWEVETGKSECRLKQAIPNYGVAVFSHRSGSPLIFSLQERRVKADIIKANLVESPTPWIHNEIVSQNYPVYLDSPRHGRDFSRLSVYGDAAEDMLDALLRGNAPTFVYVRAKTVLDMREIRVSVSPIKILESYDDFVGCREKLMHSRSKSGF